MLNAQAKNLQLVGGAGMIEALEDLPSPESTARGVAVIAHPHPLFAGTMHNKVVQTMARAFAQCGWHTIRFNFRGVGASDGLHDEGRGELEDLLSVVAQCAAPEKPLALAGFSFGAYVTSHAIQRLWSEREIQKMVLVGTAATRFDVAPIPSALHNATLVIHGEHDDTVPLADVMNWARPQVLPVMVVPGGGHFFHGQLPLLKNMVARHLKA